MRCDFFEIDGRFLFEWGLSSCLVANSCFLWSPGSSDSARRSCKSLVACCEVEKGVRLVSGQFFNLESSFNVNIYLLANTVIYFEEKVVCFSMLMLIFLKMRKNNFNILRTSLDFS